jgi:alkylated DNA repair protein (DNA oxidative demethylase)
MSALPDLFDPDGVPPGFALHAEFTDKAEEVALTEQIGRVEFSRVEMRGAVAKRRTAHFGWTYGYDSRSSEPGAPIPEFLLPLRERAATWAGIDAEAFGEALITEYPAGAGIGWHRDAPMFGDVIAGVSLLSACRMKFRPYVSPKDLVPAHARRLRRTTHEVMLTPRSGYLITGAARRDFEHRIPETESLRYSITFRTLRGAKPARER